MEEATISEGSLECNVIYEEDGTPLFVLSIHDASEDFRLPPVVLNIAAVQQLVNVLTDFLVDFDVED